MFITDAQLKTKLASNLKVADETTLPAGWDGIITDSNSSAYQDIVSHLLNRGFTSVQINQWDRGAEFESDIGLFWCLVKGAGLHGNDPTFINKLDRRAELDTVSVTIGGEIVLPGGSSGEVGYGRLDTTDDLFTRDSSW